MSIEIDEPRDARTHFELLRVIRPVLGWPDPIHEGYDQALAWSGTRSSPLPIPTTRVPRDPSKIVTGHWRSDPPNG